MGSGISSGSRENQESNRSFESRQKRCCHRITDTNSVLYVSRFSTQQRYIKTICKKELIFLEIKKVSEDDLKLINSFSKRELKADEIYTFRLVCCDNQIDRDFEKFDAGQSSKTMTQKQTISPPESTRQKSFRKTALKNYLSMPISLF